MNGWTLQQCAHQFVWIPGHRLSTVRSIRQHIGKMQDKERKKEKKQVKFMKMWERKNE